MSARFQTPLLSPFKPLLPHHAPPLQAWPACSLPRCHPPQISSSLLAQVATEACTSNRLPGVPRASKLTPPKCAAAFFLCFHSLHWSFYNRHWAKVGSRTLRTRKWPKTRRGATPFNARRGCSWARSLCVPQPSGSPSCGPSHHLPALLLPMHDGFLPFRV